MRVLRLTILARAVLIAVLVLGLASGAAAATDRQSRVLALPAGHSLSIDITVGEVRIEGADRADALVEVVRQAPAEADLARIPIVFDDSTPAISVRATQTDGTTEAALRTDITVKLPRDARVDSVRVMEGKVVIVGFAGTIGADVRRGPIEATDIAGTVRLETGIGHVVLRNAMLTPGGLLRLRTFNGDVRLSLRERPVNARVLALALNGTIGSAIPLTMKDKWGPRFGETTLGTGEPVISIDVITGHIEIEVKN
jgi:hypothetical protein